MSLLFRKAWQLIKDGAFLFGFNIFLFFYF
jgi:hypothetical protein